METHLKGRQYVIAGAVVLFTILFSSGGLKIGLTQAEVDIGFIIVGLIFIIYGMVLRHKDIKNQLPKPSKSGSGSAK